MNAADIAKALGGAKKAGKGWTCKCPAHDDKHNSLSLTEKEGRLLWKCHAGCSQEVVQAALQRRGYLEASAEAREPRRRPAGSAKPKLEPIDGGRANEPPDDEDEGGKEANTRGAEAIYEYVDVGRNAVFRVVKFPNKEFRQCRLIRNRWIWGMGRVTPFLYRLPEVAGSPGVYICEGEKDADNLAALGVVATTSPMGAGKWRPEYGRSLANKHVVILPDNDEPGRKHAAQAAASCFDHGARSIRILNLPGLGEHGDVSDWLAAGHTREQLSELVHATPAWRPDQPGGNPAWEHSPSLLLDEDNKPLANEANLLLALEQAPELCGRVRYELFFNRVEARNLPWDVTTGDWRPWTDTDTTAFAVWAQRHRININANRAYRPVDLMGRTQPHHAPRSYLSGLKWDGEPRIDNWLIFYLGAEPAADASPEAAKDYLAYLRAIGPKFLISAVARIFRPGCKVDTMLVIEGGQGKLKSTAIKILFGDGEWFSDHISPVGTKDSKEELAGKWCIEVSELSALQRSDVEKIKAFLSTAVDNYRPSYGHLPRAFPRQCVFFGSTNEDRYLRDATGARRFWPFKAGHIDIEALRKDRDQLWAEAVHRYHAGEQWHLTTEEEALAGGEQGEREVLDPWFDAVSDYLETASFVTVGVLLYDACKVPKDRWDGVSQKRVVSILKKLGWVPGSGRLTIKDGEQDRQEAKARRGWRAPPRAE